MGWIWRKEANVDDLIEVLKRFAYRNGYKVERVGDDVLEINKSGGMRIVTGLSSSVRLVIETSSDSTILEPSEYVKEYILKAVIGFFGFYLTFGILTVCAGIGAYNQYKLLEGLRQATNDYMNGL